MSGPGSGGPHAGGIHSPAGDSDATKAFQALESSQGCLAVCESCTGGGLAQRITAVAGSSKVFWGGWVTYDNSAKQSQLGVDASLLARHGAVSSEVARAMAEGGLARMSAAIEVATQLGTPGATGLTAQKRRFCVSTTGVAGPSGGTATKPVGLCYIAVAALGRPTVVTEIRAPQGQSRAQNQDLFANSALQELLKQVQSYP